MKAAIQLYTVRDDYKNPDEFRKVLRKIKFMYKNLPEYLKQPVVNGRGEDIGTAQEIEFANGSVISSIPTTEEAGRSEAGTGRRGDRPRRGPDDG